MKTEFKDPPRTYEVKGHAISDMGNIFLDENEQVTFVTPGGKECDFAAKNWGFYLGPSLNGRLKRQGFKVALAINENNQIYVHAVEEDKIDEFKKYLKTNHDNKLVCWLDEWFQEEA
ncbi:MAG: hypothetical protein H6756_09575 [Candidatus Omnitrophica bacterium]|nr:hypothetical protein [Candidatus Omnitrophota bacterium]